MITCLCCLITVLLALAAIWYGIIYSTLLLIECLICSCLFCIIAAASGIVIILMPLGIGVGALFLVLALLFVPVGG